MNMYALNGTNSVYPMNGFTNRVQPMNGQTSRVQPMNGTNNVYPLNGTNQVIPMQGIKGNYYVSPLSIMDITDVPDDWFPKTLSPDDILLLKTAYLSGDQRALNGFWSSIVAGANKVAHGISHGIGQAYTGIAYANQPEKKEAAREGLDQVGGDLYDKINKAVGEASKYDKSTTESGMSDADKVGGAGGGGKKIDWDNIGDAARDAAARAAALAKEKAQEALNAEMAKQAERLAAQAAAALTNAGLIPDTSVIADKAVMAVQKGLTPGRTGGGVLPGASGGIFSKVSDWWKGAGTGEKSLAVGGGLLALYGLGKYVVIPLINPKKGRKRK